jgi:hypothetical protein
LNRENGGRIHLRAPRIPRLLGNDRECILYIGYGNNLRKRFNDFLSSSRNGTSTSHVGQTLFYYRHRSPGMAALIGDDVEDHLRFSYKEIKDGDLLSAFTSYLYEYIKVFAELPPLNGAFKGISGSARGPLKARHIKEAPEQWTYIDHPSEIDHIYPKKLPVVYRVHLKVKGIPRSLKLDNDNILSIGHALSARERLLNFLDSARNGCEGHSEGVNLHRFIGLSPALRALFGGKDVSARLRFSYRVVDPRDLFGQENISTDRYIYPFGELPPLNCEITGMRKRILALRKEMGIMDDRLNHD